MLPIVWQRRGGLVNCIMPSKPAQSPRLRISPNWASDRFVPAGQTHCMPECSLIGTVAWLACGCFDCVDRIQGLRRSEAFTLRFVPAREDIATPANWKPPISTRADRVHARRLHRRSRCLGRHRCTPAAYPKSARHCRTAAKRQRSRRRVATARTSAPRTLAPERIGVAAGQQFPRGGMRVRLGD